MAKFDKEFSTQWVVEYEYLKEHGVLPTFVKDANDDSKITTYKYKKTVELFKNLYDLYNGKIYYK